MKDREHFPPPYYAVIFTSKRTEAAADYLETNDHLISIAEGMEGYLGQESARDESIGVSVSLWKDLASIKIFKEQLGHKMSQARGRQEWYISYRGQNRLLERDYEFST